MLPKTTGNSKRFNCLCLAQKETTNKADVRDNTKKYVINQLLSSPCKALVIQELTAAELDSFFHSTITVALTLLFII